MRTVYGIGEMVNKRSPLPASGRSGRGQEKRGGERKIMDNREKIKAIVKNLESRMQCNCNLDKWEPERLTGHSFVCRIHRAALAEAQTIKSAA